MSVPYLVGLHTWACRYDKERFNKKDHRTKHPERQKKNPTMPDLYLTHKRYIVVIEFAVKSCNSSSLNKNRANLLF